MKKILKKIILVNVFLSVIIFASSIYAATANISATKVEAYVGDAVNINISINAAAWNLNVSGSGITGENITGFNMEGTNQSINKSYRLNTSSAGTYTIYLKGDISDGATDITTDISNSVTVTVKTKPVTTPATTPPTPSTNTTTQTKPQANTTTSNKNDSTTTTLSSNAYLSQFRVDQPGITPAFSKTIYNYAITVGEDVNNLNVTAVPEYNKATVSISGNTNLKEGDNTITIRVTAQDKKNVKTYRIIVTKTDDPVKSNAYLQSLFVKDLTLNPTFSAEVFEYTLGAVDSSLKKIEIAAFPVNENAKVDVVGNDNLVVGENTIKVIVTSENAKNQKTYTLKVTKEKEENRLVDLNSDEDKAEKSEADESSNFREVLSMMRLTLKENAAVLLLYALAWIEFLQVVYLYEKIKKMEIKNVGTNIKEEIEIDKEKRILKRIRVKENIIEKDDK